MECLGRSPKELHCCMRLLDETEKNLTIQSNSKGSVLLDHVFAKLNLLEKDYFGLRFLDNHDQTHWLEPSKLINKQIKNGPPYTLYFGVKFYMENPCRLKEEVTRYQFFLQLRMDMLQGRLPASFHTTAELCAYATQSELGDYDPNRHSEGYVSVFRFIPNQTEELEQEISQIHNKLKGMTPSKAELNFLERARRLDMYGVDLHPVIGDKNVEFFLGLTPIGVVVYKNKVKVACYFWPRISKVHFKDTEFTLLVLNKDGHVDDCIFRSTSRAACKYLWQCCVEQHVFFRLVQTGGQSSHQRGFSFSKSSLKHTYSGRTQREALEAAATLDRPEQVVKRASSRKYNRRPSQSDVTIKNISASEDVSLENSLTNPNGVVLHLAPQPNNRFPSNYRQTSGRDSPTSGISIRSVPWEDAQQVGLFTPAGGSPVSVRSSASRQQKYWGRSRSPGPHSHHSERSDTESEMSYSTRRRRKSGGSDAGSGHEARHHNQHRKRRSRSRGVSSGSESEYDRHDDGRRRRRRKSRERTSNSERREGVPDGDRMVRGELRGATEVIIKRLGETDNNASKHNSPHRIKSSSPQHNQHTTNYGKSRHLVEPTSTTTPPYIPNGIAHQRDDVHTRNSPLVREGYNGIGDGDVRDNSYPGYLNAAGGLYSNNRQPQRNKDLHVAQVNGSQYSDRRYYPDSTSHNHLNTSPIRGMETLRITHSRDDSGLGNENGDTTSAESKQARFPLPSQDGHSAPYLQTSRPGASNHRTDSYPMTSKELNSFGKDMRTSPANTHYNLRSSPKSRLDENQFHRTKNNFHDTFVQPESTENSSPVYLRHDTSQSRPTKLRLSPSSGLSSKLAGTVPKESAFAVQNNNTKVVTENGGHWSTPIEPDRVFATSSLVDDRDLRNEDMPRIVNALPDVPPGYRPGYRGGLIAEL